MKTDWFLNKQMKGSPKGESFFIRKRGKEMFFTEGQIDIWRRICFVEG